MAILSDIAPVEFLRCLACGEKSDRPVADRPGHTVACPHCGEEMAVPYVTTLELDEACPPLSALAAFAETGKELL